jgi:hypothetical protein
MYICVWVVVCAGSCVLFSRLRPGYCSSDEQSEQRYQVDLGVKYTGKVNFML